MYYLALYLPFELAKQVLLWSDLGEELSKFFTVNFWVLNFDTNPNFTPREGDHQYPGTLSIMMQGSNYPSLMQQPPGT